MLLIESIYTKLLTHPVFQCCFSELIISNLLHLELYKDIILDLLMCGIFIASGILIDNIFCMMIYTLTYAFFVLLNYKRIQRAIHILKNYR